MSLRSLVFSLASLSPAIAVAPVPFLSQSSTAGEVGKAASPDFSSMGEFEVFTSLSSSKRAQLMQDLYAQANPWLVRDGYDESGYFSFDTLTVRTQSDKNRRPSPTTALYDRGFTVLVNSFDRLSTTPPTSFYDNVGSPIYIRSSNEAPVYKYVGPGLSVAADEVTVAPSNPGKPQAIGSYKAYWKTPPYQLVTPNGTLGAPSATSYGGYPGRIRVVGWTAFSDALHFYTIESSRSVFQGANIIISGGGSYREYFYENQYTGVNDYFHVDREIPRTFYYDASELFALDRVGYDPTHGEKGSFFYDVGLNKALLSGAIGVYFNSSMSALLSSELGNSITSARSLSSVPDFSGIEYWNEASKRSNLSWGPSSWVDPAVLSSNQDVQYWANVQRLALKLRDIAGESRDAAGNLVESKSHLLNYTNYLAVKDAVSKEAAATRVFPSDEFIDSLFSSGQIERGAWVGNALSYGLDSTSLADLIVVLPQLSYAQWSMNDTSGQDSGNWDNPSQSYVAIEGETKGKTAFSIADIMARKNRVYINDDSTSADGTLRFSVGVDTPSDIQVANRWELGAQIQPSVNERSGVKIGLLHSNLAVNGDPLKTVKQGGSFAFTSAGGNRANSENYFSFSKKAFTVAKTTDLSPSIKILAAEAYKSMKPSEVLALKADVFASIRDALVDDKSARVFPYALFNPYESTWTYDVDPKRFAFAPDDSAGTVKVSYLDESGKAASSVTVTGFATDTQDPLIVPGDGTGSNASAGGGGFPDWAIAAASVGGAALVGGSVWFAFARRRVLRKKHRKAKRGGGEPVE